MNIIKLNAIESTNSYLKDLMQYSSLENYTVVIAENQTLGRGQMGALWEVEPGKSLTFSVLVRLGAMDIQKQFYFNMCVSLACYEVLKRKLSAKVKVKWPNDIMADKDKIAGILIENSIKGQTISSAVVGVGINVNQLQFPRHLKAVSSMAKLEGFEFDKEALLQEFIQQLQLEVSKFENKKFQAIKEAYLKALFAFQVPSMFETPDGIKFLGKIVAVNSKGKLVVEMDGEKTREFGIKEITFARL